MEHLQEIIKQLYGLRPLTVQPNGPVWKLSASSGNFLVKRMGCTADQIEWLANSIDLLLAGGFNGLSPFLRTKSGSSYFEYGGQNYIISLWHHGEHPSFSNQAHLKQTACLLGRLHQTSFKALHPASLPEINPLNELRRKITFLEELVHNLKEEKQPNRIDRSIIHWSDYYLSQAYFCLEETVRLNRWLLTAKAKGFCHQDPAPRNIIISNINWILIDYELSGINLFASEITTLLHRALSLQQWQLSLFDFILAAYQSERPLADEELSLIRISLCFPRKFWRLCSQRFEEKLKWTQKHYQSKFWELYHRETDRFNLLKGWFPQLKPFKDNTN